ncbi:MAG TPA: family 78 glycoside hydrolase catalytic domain [Bryobacteraceae bacterium]|jgi:alpha-L-rhamnosidase|nr:family 78 glycoside hydrolase catalytic domain [Bryobacteraceae bacterium]
MRAIILLSLAAVPALARPVDLRCGYLTNPLGIDQAQPRLSWRSDHTERNWTQSAYQVRVASSVTALAAGQADVWDSGKQTTSDSIGIVYAGKNLAAGRRYFWTVRVWDAQGRAEDAAEPAWFETGLLASADWKAKWISRKDPAEDAVQAALHWIWVAGQDAFAVAPKTAAVFHKEVDLSGKPAEAALFVAARGAFKAKINGQDAGAKSDFRAFDRQDVTNLLRAGRNTIEVTVTALPPGFPFGGAQGKGVPAAMAALLQIRDAGGNTQRQASDAHWQARLETEPDFKPAGVVGDLADKRLGADTGPLPGPASLLRREFSVAKPIRAARLYVTALGSYRAFLNGSRVGDDLLTPEYTDYSKRVTYQTYDVTTLLTRGRNAIGAMLGDGWFGSGLTWTGLRFSFLPGPTRFLAQLQIDYADGMSATVVSDDSWRTAPAPVLHSEIYAGEVYDARLEQPGWDKGGFNDAAWAPALVSEAPPGILSAEVTVPARIVARLKPESVTEHPNGAWIVDMGQNMVGWLRVKATGGAGTRIRLSFAEILSPDGSLYRDNLRNANSTDVLYLRGGAQTWSPHFTFHGFRYVEVTGFPGKPDTANFEGEVVSSAQTLTGKLSTSSDLVNKMWQVAIWGERSNFLSIPTDCPQRDERLGWTGDAEVFWRTGAYNADIAAFGHKWLRDLTDDQTAEGAFGNVAPGVAKMGPFFAAGAPGWGDAGVIVPWTAWQQYGDRGLVSENWTAMERWMKFIADGNPDFLRKKRLGPDFADWLAPDSRTPHDLIATAYWSMMAGMMSQMAHAIGQETAAANYADLGGQIRAAFQKAYIKADGTVGTGTETCYVLALHMNLVPEPLRMAAVERLVKEIEAKQWHVSTGFLGTPHLLFALAENGRVDVAYRLLLTETYPSWGYMIRKGATTWWERWNSDSGDPAMNSFNHYAFGSVVAWIYRYVAGIGTETSGPGFREIVIHPRTAGPITHARGEYDSVYGKIVSDWTAGTGGDVSLRVVIPPNTRAMVYLYAKPDGRVTESGKPVKAREGPDGTRIVSVGSGSYTFETR